MVTRRPRFIMMVPLRRCGSHAIRLRLNLLPGFCAPYPLHIVDLVPHLERYGDLSSDPNYQRLIHDVVALCDTSPIPWEYRPSPEDLWTLLSPPSEHRSVHRIVAEMYIQYALFKKATMVMDKSNDSIHYWQEYHHLFPDILFLDVVRDPRYQIASMNRCILYDHDTPSNLQRWIQARQAADHLLHSLPDQVLRLRYEDLSHPSFFPKLCRFLSLPYLPDRLEDISQSTEAARLASLSPLWSQNDRALFSPPPVLPTLSSSDLDLIETQTQPWLPRFHYSSTLNITTLSPEEQLVHQDPDLERRRRRQQIICPPPPQKKNKK